MLLSYGQFSSRSAGRYDVSSISGSQNLPTHVDRGSIPKDNPQQVELVMITTARTFLLPIYFRPYGRSNTSTAKVQTVHRSHYKLVTVNVIQSSQDDLIVPSHQLTVAVIVSMSAPSTIP